VLCEEALILPMRHQFAAYPRDSKASAGKGYKDNKDKIKYAENED